MARIFRLRNDLYCVGWGVKLYSLTHLARILPLIDLTHRPEQSGFVAGRSTIDAILALRLLSELHREFDRPLNVVYLDIKAAFDSVDRRTLWKALRSRGVPAILLYLISALHDGTAVRVRVGQELSGHLLTTSGVRQGCVLAPSLFCIAIDWILRHMISRPGITVGQHFTDLVYADDTAFLVDSPTQASSCLSSFNEAAAVFGLRNEIFHGQRLKFKTSALDHSHRLFWSTEIPLT